MKAPALLDTVPPQLPTGGRCKIAFVGEAPSDYERLYGYPLVGPAGRTFDQILRISGLACAGRGAWGDRAARVGRLLNARCDYLVTNVFDFQLPDNQVKNICAPAGERATWKDYDYPILRSSGYLRPEFLPSLTRLSDELTAAKPNIIVPLGSTALWALTGISDITLARGAITTATRVAPGVKILPTYHPSHVQQEFRLFHVTVADLVKVAHEAAFPEVRLVARRVHIRPTLADLSRWEKLLLQADRLAVDIETAKQQITCIGFATGPGVAYVIPFADYANPSRSYWKTAEQEAAAWAVVRRVCESAIPKTMQNGLYDCYYLIRQAGIWPANYKDDTRLQHHALYPELPKSLAFMGATYAQQGPWKLMADHRRDKRDD